MQLRDLIRGLAPDLAGNVDSLLEIGAITEDSREVTAGSLFVARGGMASHGGAFVADAVARGAVAVVTDHETETPEGVCTIRTRDVARVGAAIAERFYGSPSSDLALLGVTGTNGKTTVAHLTQQILTRCGMKCGLLGTVLIDDGAVRTPACLTTPSAIEISRTLSRMVANQCGGAVMEVSSHALHQHRVAGLTFRGGVFTNLSGDHLDYHGSMEEYAAAKATLFDELGPEAFAIVNVDDPASARMVQNCAARVVRCSAHDDRADAFISAEPATIDGAAVTLHGPFGVVCGRTRLHGAHNLMNLLQAVAAAHAIGVDVSRLAGELETLEAPPGRLEPVLLDEATRPTVLVDYAHTDDALANALRAVRPIVPAGGRLWVVFGCGGDRDTSKRPRMGQVAASFADCVVVTSDNPRSEDPQLIVDQIVAGIDDAGHSEVVVKVDRAAAIQHAIDGADDRDVIVIAGKGHEDYQIISDGAGGVVRRDFDDRIEARRALAARARAVTP